MDEEDEEEEVEEEDEPDEAPEDEDEPPFDGGGGGGKSITVEEYVTGLSLTGFTGVTLLVFPVGAAAAPAGGEAAVVVFDVFAAGAYQLTSARGGVAELLAVLAPGGGYCGCWCGLVVHFVGSTGGYTGCGGAAAEEEGDDEEL